MKRFGSWIVSSWLLMGCGLLAQSPHLQQADIFVAGENGYHTYRIPALAVTTNGTVLAFCEGRKNSRSDTGDIDMLVKRSTDGGRTWSRQQVIWSDAENTCGNPAPVVDQSTGTIWLLMTWNAGKDQEHQIDAGGSTNTRRAYVTSSSDDGVTWTSPKEITADVKKPDWGWYATGPVNGIQLTRGNHKGRLVIPANHSLKRDGKQVTRSHIIYSDDHGATWKLGGIEDEKTNESTIVELANGDLLHNMRAYHGKNRRAIARSNDGGMTWSPVTLDDALIEPVCQGSILRVTWPEAEQKSRIMFSNPAGTKRVNMTVRVSYDEGRTWPASRTLHSGPSAYSCLAVLPDNTVACLYERGDKNSYEKLTLARFPVAWVDAKKEP
jgi:sialidase-1